MIPKHLKISQSSPFGSGIKKNIRKTKMAVIRDKVKKVDQHLSRAVAEYRSKHQTNLNYNKTEQQLH